MPACSSNRRRAGEAEANSNTSPRQLVEVCQAVLLTNAENDRRTWPRFDRFRPVPFD